MGAGRRIARAGAWLALGLGALGLAAVLGLVALDRGLARERVRALVARALGDALGAPVQIGALEGVLHDAITLRDVRVGGGPEAPLALDALDLDLDLVPLLRERRLVIERLRARGLEISLVRDADGGWTVRGLPAPQAGGAPAPEGGGAPLPVGVEVREIALEQARVHVRFEDSLGTSELHGLLDASAEQWRLPATGRAALPRRAALTLTLDPSILRGRPVTEGTLHADLEGGRVRLLPSVLAGDFGALGLEGTAELAPQPDALAIASAALELRARALDLAVLTGDGRLVSRLDATLHVETVGASAAARELAVRARVTPSTVAGLDLERAELAGRVRLGDRRWRLERVRASGPGGRVEASGTGTADRLERLALDVVGLELERLPEAVRGSTLLAGRVDASAQLSGPVRDPRGPFEASARGLASGARGPADLDLSGRLLGDRRVELDAGRASLAGSVLLVERPSRVGLAADGALVFEPLALRWPDGGTVVLTGRLRDGRAEPLRAEISRLDVRAAAALAELDTALGGTLDAQLVARGRIARPLLEGAAVWETPSLADVRAERALLALSGDAKEIRATLHLIEDGREALRLDVNVPTRVALSSPGALVRDAATQVRARADAFELGWIAPLVPPRYGRPDGVASLDVTLRGATPRPELAGHVEVLEGRIPVAPLGVTLTPVEGRIELAPDRVTLAALRIGSGDGAAFVEGTVPPGGAGDADLRVRFETFALARTPMLRADLDGAVHAAGSVPALHVEGELVLANARVGLPEAEDPLLKEIRVQGLEEEATTTLVEQPLPSAPLLGPASVALRLRIPRNTWVEGRGLEAEVEGALEVRKEPGGDPVILGSVEVVRGRYRFQGRTFRIERGVATFTGTREIDPELDFVAVQRVRDVTLRAVIGGRASSPRLRLESDPPLDSTDLLSYLAFGRPAHELGAGESVRLESAATRLAGGLVAGSLVSALAPALPVDLLDVSLTENGPAVEVGKYLGENLFVRYARALGETDGDRVRIEWRFLERWSLESDITRAGSAGADLVWSYDY